MLIYTKITVLKFPNQKVFVKHFCTSEHEDLILAPSTLKSTFVKNSFLSVYFTD